MLIFYNLQPEVIYPPPHDKCWIFGGAFTDVSGLVSAYRFIKAIPLKIMSNVLDIIF